MRAALISYVTTTGLLTAVTLAGVDSLFVLIGMLFISFAAMGLVIPSTAVLALENYGLRAGTASALMGTIQLVSGVAVIGFMGLVTNGTVLPMVGTIFVCALIAFTLSRLVLRSDPSPPAE